MGGDTAADKPLHNMHLPPLPVSGNPLEAVDELGGPLTISSGIASPVSKTGSMSGSGKSSCKASGESIKSVTFQSPPPMKRMSNPASSNTLPPVFSSGASVSGSASSKSTRSTALSVSSEADPFQHIKWRAIRGSHKKRGTRPGRADSNPDPIPHQFMEGILPASAADRSAQFKALFSSHRGTSRTSDKRRDTSASEAPSIPSDYSESEKSNTDTSTEKSRKL